MPTSVDDLGEIIQKKFAATEDEISAKMQYLKQQATIGETKGTRDAAAQGLCGTSEIFVTS